MLSIGCASITGTPNQNVSVQTREQSGKEVRGTNCELTNNKDKWFVMTPGSVGIQRSNQDLQALCTREDLEPGRTAIYRPRRARRSATSSSAPSSITTTVPPTNTHRSFR
jgi:hypothetical protein